MSPVPQTPTPAWKRSKKTRDPGAELGQPLERARAHEGRRRAGADHRAGMARRPEDRRRAHHRQPLLLRRRLERRLPARAVALAAMGQHAAQLRPRRQRRRDRRQQSRVVRLHPGAVPVAVDLDQRRQRQLRRRGRRHRLGLRHAVEDHRDVHPAPPQRLDPRRACRARSRRRRSCRSPRRRRRPRPRAASRPSPAPRASPSAAAPPRPTSPSSGARGSAPRSRRAARAAARCCAASAPRRGAGRASAGRRARSWRDASPAPPPGSSVSQARSLRLPNPLRPVMLAS